MEKVFEDEGRYWVRGALSSRDLKLLDQVSSKEQLAGSRLEWSELLVEAAGISSNLNLIAERVLTGAKPVRFVSFNKNSKTNWSLPWHQDRVIAVKGKVEKDGFINWSQKAGQWHCEPPTEILEKMVFARIHLDASDETNGCLELSIGSHKYGKILSEDIDNLIAKLPRESCIAERGDILFVKALTLHRSAVSNSSLPRKAIRVDYAHTELPAPLGWQY